MELTDENVAPLPSRGELVDICNRMRDVPSVSLPVAWVEQMIGDLTALSAFMGVKLTRAEISPAMLRRMYRWVDPSLVPLYASPPKDR